MKKRSSFINYKREALDSALQEVRNGKMTVRQAAREFHVPRSTLQDRVRGRVAEDCTKVGRSTILTPSEENLLCSWLCKVAKCGFPQKRDDVLNAVQNIVKKDKRTTPFINGRPGRRWYELFMKRNPDLKERASEVISKGRTVVTEEYIRKWFTELHSFLRENNCDDILSDPTRVLNGDETNFNMCSKTGKIIAPKEWRNVYEITSGNEKETISVFMIFSANGEIVDPMVVFPYIRPPKEVIESMPPDWILGRSESGWMRSETFYEYLVNVNKWLEKKEVQKPALLFVDGHKLHLTMEMTTFCDTNGIILYALPANTTHIMHPADVSVFRPLKVDWKKTVRQWENRIENANRVLTRATFCPLLHRVLQTNMKEAIMDGFRKCGLFPFDPDAIDYIKCALKATKNDIEKTKTDSEKSITDSQIDLCARVLTIAKKPLSEKGIDVDLVINTIRNFMNAKEKIVKRKAEALENKNVKKSKKNLPEESNSATERTKCNECDEELSSDIENDELKNIGCDKCFRWYHLKCTSHKDEPYAEGSPLPFICRICVDLES